MTKLSDEQLAEIREGFEYRAADCQLCQADDLVRLLVLHIDAQQERIDALEAERAEMRREFRIIEADGTVYAEGDVALEGDYTRDLQPGDALYRRDTYTGPWLPVQEDDRG